MSKKIEKDDREEMESFSYDRSMVIIDEITEGIIEELDELTKNGDYSSEKVVSLSKVLKNLTSSKKNILKADLLSIELDDTLYDDFDDEDEIEEVEEVEDMDDEDDMEEIKPTKTSTKSKSKK